MSFIFHCMLFTMGKTQIHELDTFVLYLVLQIDCACENDVVVLSCDAIPSKRLVSATKLLLCCWCFIIFHLTKSSARYGATHVHLMI